MVQPPSESAFDSAPAASSARTLAHYDGQLELAKEWARRRQAAFNEVVDFVEAHGGALSGEQRGELWELCEKMGR